MKRDASWNIAMSDQPTQASGSQVGLIDAAWRQVAGLARPVAGSSGPGSTITPHAAPALPADAFPGYRLISEIHRGGQGVVYKALQESTQREVAIKVLRDGHLLTPTDVARFEQEVRILGQLRHANVVRIFDSCAAASRFYYVMDYIPGLPLDAYVHQALPGMRSVDELVRLFVKICDAVNAAHLRGIIHRDLKPGNIRVDRAGEPYVLDFGLSKLATDDASEVTQSGQFIGSIPWASPEQAAARSGEVDLRTDVYALGVLLYQMLTGQFPYSMDGRPHELLRRIIDDAPTPLRQHVPDIPADLETIVLKCLQKAPERRYQSAGELRRDLKHYLAREPIEARRDSYTYVLTKQLVRYRVAAVASAAVLLALAAALVVSLAYWRLAEAARDAAETERENARASARLAQAANRFLNDMLSRADRGEQAGNPDVRVRDVLDEAAADLLAGASAAEPEVRENLLGTIGKTYQALGLFAAAERCLAEVLTSRRSRGTEGEAELSFSLLHLAAVRRELGRLAEAEALADEALTLRRKRLGPDDPLVGAALNDVGTIRLARRDYRGAESLFREALGIWAAQPPEEPESVASVKLNLGLALQALGQLDAAEALDREALALLEQLHGREHPSVATAQNNLGAVLMFKGEFETAEECYRAALALRRTLYGDEHALVALSLNNLAGLLHDSGRDLAGAERLYREALEMRERVLGPRHRDTISTRGNLASVVQDLDRPDEAAELYALTIALQREALGPHDPGLASTLANLATLHTARGELAAAERLLREAVEIWRAQGNPQHPSLALQLGNLGTALTQMCRWDEAEAALREALQIRRAVGDEREVTRALAGLGVLLSLRGASGDAAPVLRDALARLGALQQSASAAALSCMASLGLALSELAWDQRARPGPAAAALSAEAEGLLRSCLDTRTRQLAPGDRLLSQTRSLLGGAIVAHVATAPATGSSQHAVGTIASRLQAAESLLRAGYDGLTAESPAQPRTPLAAANIERAAARLARLYELWNEIDPTAARARDAELWRSRAAPDAAATRAAP